MALSGLGIWSGGDFARTVMVDVGPGGELQAISKLHHPSVDAPAARNFFSE
jgi:hypothetical protein